MTGLRSLRAAAADLGLPYSAVWRAVKSGALVTIRFAPRGRHWVREAELQAWVGRHFQQTGEVREVEPSPALAGRGTPRTHPPTCPRLEDWMPRERRFN